MKYAVMIALALVFASALSAGTTVALTGAVSEDFFAKPSFGDAVGAFGEKQPFGGLGWEVVLDQMGMGGTYLVDFFQDSRSAWWMDWYSEAFYLSCHVLGGGAALDPFLRAGLGSAGRVSVRGGPGTEPPLELTVFPFVGAGLGLRLGTFSMGANVDLVPYPSPIPATTIPAYPLGRFQIGVFAGFILG